MVNGGAYLLVSDRPFLRGSGRCLDLSPAVRNSPILRFRGSEIRRRYCQPTICKLKKGDDLLGNSKLARKSKRKGVDLSEARTLQQLQSSDSIYASSVRGFSTKSVASPASEMEMVAEEDMEADDDDELSVYRGLVLDMAYR